MSATDMDVDTQCCQVYNPFLSNGKMNFPDFNGAFENIESQSTNDAVTPSNTKKRKRNIISPSPTTFNKHSSFTGGSYPNLSPSTGSTFMLTPPNSDYRIQQKLNENADFSIHMAPTPDKEWFVTEERKSEQFFMNRVSGTPSLNPPVILYNPSTGNCPTQSSDEKKSSAVLLVEQRQTSGTSDVFERFYIEETPQGPTKIRPTSNEGFSFGQPDWSPVNFNDEFSPTPFTPSIDRISRHTNESNNPNSAGRNSDSLDFNFPFLSPIPSKRTSPLNFGFSAGDHSGGSTFTIQRKISLSSTTSDVDTSMTSVQMVEVARGTISHESSGISRGASSFELQSLNMNDSSHVDPSILNTKNIFPNLAECEDKQPPCPETPQYDSMDIDMSICEGILTQLPENQTDASVQTPFAFSSSTSRNQSTQTSPVRDQKNDSLCNTTFRSVGDERGKTMLKCRKLSWTPRSPVDSKFVLTRRHSIEPYAPKSMTYPSSPVHRKEYPCIRYSSSVPVSPIQKRTHVSSHEWRRRYREREKETERIHRQHTVSYNDVMKKFEEYHRRNLAANPESSMAALMSDSSSMWR